MNAEARRQLIEHAYAILEEGTTLLAVPLQQFFEGNTDERSIGVNLSDDEHIGLDGFRRTLTTIRNRPNVQDVFLELTEIPDADDPEEDAFWPIACVAFIVTSEPLSTVQEWVKPLRPRDVAVGWHVKEGVNVPLAEGDLLPGMQPIRVWLL